MSKSNVLCQFIKMILQKAFKMEVNIKQTGRGDAKINNRQIDAHCWSQIAKKYSPKCLVMLQ